MQSVIKKTRELSCLELTALWHVYDFAYVKPTNIPSLSEEQWLDAMLKPFCYTGKDKLIQVYGEQNATIPKILGYSLFSAPESYNNHQVSKLFQQAIGNTEASRSALFLAMTKELKAYGDDNQLTFIAEIGKAHHWIQGLLNTAGFTYVQDKEAAHHAMGKIFGHNNFSFKKNANGLLLCRATQLQQAHEAYLLISNKLI